MSTSAYMNMLKGAKKAKQEGRDTFEYFVKAATTGTDAYKLTSRGIECKENVAGMTVIFVCMALIKLSSAQTERKADMILMLKSHLSALMKMRMSTGVPLCIISEEEGIMFAGEGMSLRFLNALIILESLLVAKLKGDAEYLREVWGVYSSMDLVVYLELPALLNGVLDEKEIMEYAKSVAASDPKSPYFKERSMASDLIRATVRNSGNEVEGVSPVMLVVGILLLLLYTGAVVKLSQLEW